MAEARFLTLAQAAEQLAVTAPQVRRAVERGQVPAVRIGRSWRIPVGALEQLAEQNRRPEPPLPEPAPTPKPPPPKRAKAAELALPGVRLLRSREVAELCNVSVHTVGGWARAGKLPSLRTAGGQRRFREVDVRRVLDGRLGQ